MENGKGETKVETVTNDAAAKVDEVKTEKPVSKVEENAAKQTSDEPSSELLEKIKNQIEVIVLLNKLVI